MFVGGVVGGHEHDEVGGVGCGLDGVGRNDEGVVDGPSGDGGVDRGSGFEGAFGVFYAEPNLDGGAAGVESGADEGDFGGNGLGHAGDGDGSGGSDGELLCLTLGDVELGDEGGGVHDGEEGGPGGGGFACKEGAVGDDSVDGAADFGVAELGFCAEVLALGGGKLALSVGDGGLVAELLNGVEVEFGDVVGGLGLEEGGLGSVEVAAGDGSLGKELSAGVDDALVEVEIGFGLGEVELGFGEVLGDGGAGGGLVGGLGCGVGTFVVKGGGGEVRVLQGGEELSCLDVGSALDEEFFDRCGDLGRDGGLGERGEDGVGGDLLGDASLLRVGCLDVDLGGGSSFLFFAAGGENGGTEEQQERTGRSSSDEGSGHGLDRSCEYLEVGQSSLVTDGTVFAGNFREGQGVLGVDDFEDGGLTGGVAEAGEVEAFLRGLYAEVEGLELVAGGGGLGVVLVELGDEAALGGGEVDACGVADDLCLTDLVLGGEPVPDGDVEGGSGGVAEVAVAVGTVDGELCGVNTVGEVEAEVGEVGLLGGGDVEVADAEGGGGALELGVELGGSEFDLVAGGERRGDGGDGEGEGRARVREEEDAEFEVGLLDLESGVGEIALSLLLLELGFDYVGVGAFAGGLTLLGEGGEGGRFGGSALGYGELVVSGEGAVVEADDGGDEAAAGEFQLSGGEGGEGIGTSDGGDLLEADGLIDDGLAGVFVDGVVGDEAGGGGDDGGVGGGDDASELGGLGVEILVVIDGGGQEGCAGDGAVDTGDTAGSVGCGEGGLVGTGAGDSFVEGDGQRLGGWLGGRWDG